MVASSGFFCPLCARAIGIYLCSCGFPLFLPKVIFCALTLWLSVVWMQENHNNSKVEEFGEKKMV